MSIPKELRYTKEHEWARLDDGNVVVVGVTDFAQAQLGDVVFIEVPTAGEDVSRDEPFGTIESTKSVSDLISPVTGVVLEGNTELLKEPQIINEDAYGDGWIMKVHAESADELDELMSPQEYEVYVADLEDDH